MYIYFHVATILFCRGNIQSIDTAEMTWWLVLQFSPVTIYSMITYTALQNGDFLQRTWAKQSRLSLLLTTPQIGKWSIVTAIARKS